METQTLNSLQLETLSIECSNGSDGHSPRLENSSSSPSPKLNVDALSSSVGFMKDMVLGELGGRSDALSTKLKISRTIFLVGNGSKSVLGS